MEPRGRKFLKVVGILMIVFAGIGLLSSILSFFGATVLISMGAGAVITWISIIISVLGCAYELFAGIYGVKNSANCDKAKNCITIGVIMIAIQVISTVIGYIYSLDTASLMALQTGTTSSTGSLIVSSVIGLVLGLILPILYIYGATLNSRSE